MFSAQNQMKRVWDEKLGPSRHLKRESDIPLSHHNWLTGGPGSGGGEVLQKSMFPESRVKGEYMFLDFINKYFIQLSMVWMWWKRREPFHVTLVFGWVGGMCEGKLRLLKATSRSPPEKTPIWMIGKELNCVLFFYPSWFDCRGCPAKLERCLTTISGTAVSCDRQAYIQLKADSGPQLHRGSDLHIQQAHHNSRQ